MYSWLPCLFLPLSRSSMRSYVLDRVTWDISGLFGVSRCTILLSQNAFGQYGFSRPYLSRRVNQKTLSGRALSQRPSHPRALFD